MQLAEAEKYMAPLQLGKTQLQREILRAFGGSGMQGTLPVSERAFCEKNLKKHTPSTGLSNRLVTCWASVLLSRCMFDMGSSRIAVEMLCLLLLFSGR